MIDKIEYRDKIYSILSHYFNSTELDNIIDKSGRIKINTYGDILLEKLSKDTSYVSSNVMELIYRKIHKLPDSIIYCEYCGTNPTQFSRNLGEGYRRYCSKECSNKATTESRTIWLKDRDKKLIFSKKISDIKINQYQNNKDSIVEKMIETKKKTTNNKDYGNKIKSLSKQYQEKRKEYTQKYGDIHPSQYPDAIEKRKNTIFEKYGVEHFSKTSEYKEKYKKTMLEKYGADHPSKNSNIKEKQKITRKEHFIESKLDEISKNLNIYPLFSKESFSTVDQYYKWICHNCLSEFFDDIDDGRFPKCPTCNPRSEYQQEIENYILNKGIAIKINDRTVLNGKEIDIFIPELKIGFEYHSFYHHSELSGNKNPKYHFEKFKLAREKDIKLFQIYEDEWTNKKEIVKSRIDHVLNLNKNCIKGARLFTIKVVNKEEEKDFFEKNHLHGYVPSKICIGLYLDKGFYAMMSFGKSRFDKSSDIELLRFAIKHGYSISGGASKLFQHFKNNYEFKSIISYSHNDWMLHSFYQKLGFQNNGYTNPGYSYIKNGKRYSRMKFQKYKLNKILDNYSKQLSEWENMKLNGYDRIWDSGNTIWKYENKERK